MANNPQFSDEVVEAALDAALAKANAGFLAIYDGAQPTDANQPTSGNLLVKLPLSTTAFQPSVASGITGGRVVTATANAITATTAVFTSTAGYAVLLKSDGITVVAMGSVGTSGCDFNFNSLSITQGTLVSCSSLTVTAPEN